jgi:hypothetical protein
MKQRSPGKNQYREVKTISPLRLKGLRVSTFYLDSFKGEMFPREAIVEKRF